LQSSAVPRASQSALSVLPLAGIKRVKPGDDLAAEIVAALRRSGTSLRDGDVLVVTQKIVSKSEGRLVRLDKVKAGVRAASIAKELGKDPRVIELALQESRRVVRKGQGILITETHHGFVCANSGIDMSNVEKGYVALLPVDPDASARRLREAVERATRTHIAVIVTDTFGRPWRNGQTDVAIGCSGIEPTENLSGKKDPYGYVLRVTQPAVADEVAGAAELVMGKLSMVPVAIVRGVKYTRGESGAKGLILDPRLDLFR